MAKRCKGINSKCFLITYLMIVGFLLVLWMNRLPISQNDTRKIPANLLPYVESPARPLLDFSLDTPLKLALTQQWFKGKWTFTYFSHSHCLPSCSSAYQQLAQLKSSFANKDVQFLVIGIDSGNDSAQDFSTFVAQQQLDADVATSSSSETIDALAKTFIALFLKTDYADGSYLIEQEHHIFLVDPKGRVYATFKPPLSSTNITSQFLKLRHFYAHSE